MEHEVTQDFEVQIVTPVRYLGPARLQISPETVTLTARHVRFAGLLKLLPRLPLWGFVGYLVVGIASAFSPGNDVNLGQMFIVFGVAGISAVVVSGIFTLLTETARKMLREEAIEMSVSRDQLKAMHPPAGAPGAIPNQGIDITAAFGSQSEPHRNWRLLFSNEAEAGAAHDMLGSAERAGTVAARRAGAAIGKRLK